MVYDFIKRIRNKLKQLGSGKKNEGSRPVSQSPGELPQTERADLKQPDSGTTPASGRKRKRRRRHRKDAGAPDGIQTLKADESDSWSLDAFDVPLADGKLRFHDLDLPAQIMHAIYDSGFTYCTPIQAAILPSTLAGNDATGRAQTGTGKTAAFLISIFTTFLNHPLPEKEKRKPGTPRALILAPTRELVMQIAREANSLSKYCDFQTIEVLGGIDYEKQHRELKAKKPDVLVATPGRLLDFQHRKAVDLSHVEIMVIDEADRMLDMGFIPDVRKIVYMTPPKSSRQTLLFSATLTEEVARLAMQWTKDPVKVEITPEKATVETIDQLVYLVTSEEKMALLYNIITRQNLERVIVFCNRRDETRRLAELLGDYGVNCAMISGAILQQKRIRALEDFRSGRIRVLVATDVAGRGLHIEGISHVINYTLPNDPEDYVHRIGRTGRAGAFGTSISFACEEDSFYLPDIETLLGHPLPCIHPDQEWLTLPPTPEKKPKKQPQKPTRRGAPRRRQHPSGEKRRPVKNVPETEI